MSNRHYEPEHETKRYRVALVGTAYETAYVYASSAEEAQDMYNDGDIDDWGDSDTGGMEIDYIEEA